MKSAQCALILLVLPYCVSVAWVHHRGDLTAEERSNEYRRVDPHYNEINVDYEDEWKHKKEDQHLAREEPNYVAADSCSSCDLSLCLSPPEGCPSGLVTDFCGCCEVCGRREGEKCDSYDMGHDYKPKDGYCGEHLECRVKHDLDDSGDPEFLCVCLDKQEVCGQDNKTYSTICAWKEAAVERGDRDPQILYWGSCTSEPAIVTPPKNHYEPYYGNFTLPCEAVGNPTPVIRWDLVRQDGILVELPGDYPYISVQHRGGPDAHMTTSWVQISRMEPNLAGTYICLAENNMGEAKASAIVGVYKSDGTVRRRRQDDENDGLD